MNQIAIAIDGPSGAGKSTVAKIVAKKMNFQYIDTGAMYRALTVKALENGLDVNDDDVIGEMAGKTKIRLVAEDDRTVVLLDGKDVTDAIRQPNVTLNVSAVSMCPKARVELVNQQRQMASEGGVVMDGRDIGSNVLPDAPVKIFLTASIEERGRRRYSEMKLKGCEMSLAETVADLERRDNLDSNRAINPLKQAYDAILLDSTDMLINEVVDKILEISEGKL